MDNEDELSFLIANSPADFDAWERNEDTVSIGGYDLNLELAGMKDPSLVYRWVKDEDQRLMKFMQNGWRPVVLGEDDAYNVDLKANSHSERGGWIAKKTGTLKEGQPEVCYVLAIKREWYEKDQRAKDHAIDETERGITEGVNLKEDQYSSGGIKHEQFHR